MNGLNEVKDWWDGLGYKAKKNIKIVSAFIALFLVVVVVDKLV